jgi:hypothetical protein
MARSWGIWTQHKLQLKERYDDAFTTASKSVAARVYLDLFGGEPENVARTTLEPIEGSARIALELPTRRSPTCASSNLGQKPPG